MDHTEAEGLLDWTGMERRDALREELSHARAQTDRLFDLISPDAVYQRPVEQRHRLIFYLGHFEAFDWNLLARRGMSEQAFHPEFDALFERGIDPAPGAAPSDRPSDWPKREQVEGYRRLTRERIDRMLPDLDPWLLQMAIEHRHMHAETFAYLMHSLPYADKVRDPQPPPASGVPPVNTFVSVPSGEVTLGKGDETFGWDNEHLTTRMKVRDFRVSRYKVSNAEYLEFVREGGPAPHFWTRNGEGWMFRGMFEMYPLPLDRPVWVTQRQAKAFAEWRGASLPSEAQFHRAASITRPEPARDNFDFHAWDPAPVTSGNEDARAPVQMVGNGWEWTDDLFAPFEGFRPHPFYPGYSSDFFDGDHYVLKGASPRTAALLTRPSFRNWFRPDYPYMYAGFRLVEN